jgi:hypothetical protein
MSNITEVEILNKTGLMGNETEIPIYLNPEYIEPVPKKDVLQGVDGWWEGLEGEQVSEGVIQGIAIPEVPVERVVVEKEKKSSQKQLEHMVKQYIIAKSQKSTSKQDPVPELEGRFGTRGKSLNKINYDNVIKKLLSSGFMTHDAAGAYRLSIQTQYLDQNTGMFKSSNLRTEVHGLSNIEKYCRSNDINALLLTNLPIVKFIRKSPGLDEAKNPMYDVIFPDFNFSMSYKLENEFSQKSKIIKEITNSWVNTKKTFRHMNRVSFEHYDYPIKVDLSIVRSSKNNIPTHTIGDSNTFGNQERYEIEFEIVNERVGPNTVFDTPQKVIVAIHKVMKFVLSGLQGTNYPVPISEQYDTLRSYMKIISPEQVFKYIKTSNFIGPSSYTLQRVNAGPVDENANEPNIRNNYTVTDKADGERSLLFISGTGKIYTINLNMDVVFSGAITKNVKLFNTIIDGELVLHNKKKEFINLYAAFDIYYINSHDVRANPFIQTSISESASKNRQIHYRYTLLADVIKNLDPISVMTKDQAIKSPMRFLTKKFYTSNSSTTIFEGCNTVLTTVFEYDIDGLIFTPCIIGVGSNVPGKAGPSKKVSWEYSFKWKPAKYNTIDFLVSTKKDSAGQDLITPLFKDGFNTLSQTQLIQYKTLVLQCGFNEKYDGYVNPCLDVIEDRLPEVSNLEDEHEYKPFQFYPTSPSDYSAGLCNILLKEDPNNKYNMFSEENEVFDDDTVVEFRFDKDKYDVEGKASWCWTPLRVRYDKTADYRKNKSNFGNAYKTANNNWYSIHYPVTEEMIKTGENIVVNKDEDSDVYYKNSLKSTQTKGLRNFHNLFVKKMLITSVSKRGDKLIDFACGKGGDFSKWIDANLSFVFGVDVSKDNLENRLNGACARFLGFKKKYVDMPYALFVNGDSSLNIRNGLAMKNERAKQITSAVFGQGPKDEHKLGKGVYRQFDAGKNGFQVSSCQFALHYFFENLNTFHNFMRNVSECTALNGYFIGTCYDGKTLFNRLRTYNQDDGIELYENGQKIWQVIKNYDIATLEDDETCLGQQVSVYQESINQLIPEFLVNFDFLKRMATNYGLALLHKNESKGLKLPESTGMFRELFNLMSNEVRVNKYKENEYKDALNMSINEKEISFLNRYFVFKKISDVDAEKIANSFIYGTRGVAAETDVSQKKPEVVKLTETIFLNVETQKEKEKAVAVKGKEKKAVEKKAVEPKEKKVDTKKKKPEDAEKPKPAVKKTTLKKKVEIPEDFEIVDFEPVKPKPRTKKPPTEFVVQPKITYDDDMPGLEVEGGPPNQEILVFEPEHGIVSKSKIEELKSSKK